MQSDANSPLLTLRFRAQPHLELRATEFQPKKSFGNSEVIKCSEGKAGEGQFEWREGTQALCLCLVKYLCCQKNQLAKGVKYVFEGNDKQPAKTLDGVIAKANKKNCWQLEMFGSFDNGSCRVRRFIKRRNPGQRNKSRNYELELQHDELPQEAITIEVGGKTIRSVKALEKLAETIEDQWYEVTGNESAWAKVKKFRKLRGEANKTIKSKPWRQNTHKTGSQSGPVLNTNEDQPFEPDLAIDKKNAGDGGATVEQFLNPSESAIYDYLKIWAYTKIAKVAKQNAAKYRFRPLKFSKDDLDRALAVCCKAIELLPKDAENYVYRGNVKMAQGDLDGALSDYGKAIQLDPRQGIAYSGRGDVKLAKGDTSGALADFNKARLYNEDEYTQHD